MELPEGKIIVIVFVGILTIFSYFGFDLKQILQEKLSSLFPPLSLPPSTKQVAPRQLFAPSSSSPPTISPRLNQILYNRANPHPIETVSLF